VAFVAVAEIVFADFRPLIGLGEERADVDLRGLLSEVVSLPINKWQKTATPVGAKCATIFGCGPIARLMCYKSPWGRGKAPSVLLAGGHAPPDQRNDRPTTKDCSFTIASLAPTA
jgi:hypothetical protein